MTSDNNKNKTKKNYFVILVYKVSETPQESDGEVKSYARYKYPNMSKTLGSFKLEVMEGDFTDSQIVVMLGENGTGKTTFIRMLVHSLLLHNCVCFKTLTFFFM